MKALNQKTLAKPVSFEGIGLHTGIISRVKLSPLEENKGIIFKRVDLNSDNIIEANYKNISTAILCTTLKNSSGAVVSTVEHLMAAFYITGIDNVLVEIDNIEVPIMDGSAKDFVEFIYSAGLKEQNVNRKYLKILKKVEIKDGAKHISIQPNLENFTVNFQINYENELIAKQRNKINFDKENLVDIISSRTFCLYEDVEKIKKNGLAKGGSLDNAIVVKGKEVLNKNGLRNQKEFVNHKILDLAGDFLLSGYRILGSVECTQGGHNLSFSLIKELFKDKSNFSQVIADNLGLSKRNFKTQANKLAVNA